ncbi:MAG: phosphoenolpyruvate carboxykinase (GTP) [Candidatus Altiarchaeota archaeon]
MADTVLLKEKLGDQYDKISALDNPALNDFILKYVLHCTPSKVFVCDGSKKDLQYVRDKAIEDGEERKLSTLGHTLHFDSAKDQARAKGDTAVLVPKGVELSESIRTLGQKEATEEVHAIMKGIMAGREMFVIFGCLGPNNSVFSVPAVQLSDSSYVAHNEIMLFRQGYGEFKRLKDKNRFFKFVHSQGELENGVTKNLDKRRIYMDVDPNVETVYSVNNQYGGNSLGFKKHAMRLAIARAHSDGNWLCEHMFIMGVHGPEGRVTYFAGAYPSACGKTSTAMVKGETIVGDDIAYLRVIDGEVRAANVEKGMFGIIGGVNDKGDPEIFKALTSPGEVIFSNVLMDSSGNARWGGDGRPAPEGGLNYDGEWSPSKKDAEGKPAPISHPNARYTIEISTLRNKDPMADDSGGVPLGGVIYGGRDSDTSVPIQQAFDWTHGITTIAASLESETTFATIGKTGQRVFNPMSNIDFLSIPLADYIKDDLKIVESASKEPLIFSVNYFIREDGDASKNFLTSIDDKRVWLKWMELRVHGEVGALKAPTGFIPKYDDLKKLFKQVLGKDYPKEDYSQQFKIRVGENLAKIDRIEAVYRKVPGMPETFFTSLSEQRERLQESGEKHGEYVMPEKLGE